MILNSLENHINVVYRLVMLFWRRWRYTVDVFYRRYVSAFDCNGDRSPLFTMVWVEKNLESGPCLEVSDLLSLLSDILAKGVRLCQKGDTFGHHHHVGNRLTSRMREFSLLFQFLNQTVWDSAGS